MIKTILLESIELQANDFILVKVLEARENLINLDDRNVIKVNHRKVVKEKTTFKREKVENRVNRLNVINVRFKDNTVLEDFKEIV